MLKSFYEQVAQLLLRRRDFEANGNDRTPVVGLESECCVFSDAGSTHSHQVRNSVVQNGLADFELGATQLEVRTIPVETRSWRSLHAALLVVWSHVSAAVKEAGGQILRIGANPFLPGANVPCSTREKKKYEAVPAFNQRHRLQNFFLVAGEEQVSFDTTCVGAAQALHVNLQAPSLEVGIDWVNRSLMIGPYLLALAGNSRYVLGEGGVLDTGANDFRLEAWEGTHTTSKWGWRGGLPGEYFESLEDYLARLASQPFILNDPDHALAIANGLAWLDARLKWIRNSAVVEFRMLPTQPTVEEEIALVGAYLGRLKWSLVSREELLPIETVRENRKVAMELGLRGEFFCRGIRDGELLKLRGDQMARLELEKAEYGLQFWGLNWSLVPLRLAIQAGGSPSDRLAAALGQRQVVSKEEMLAAMLHLGMVV